VVLAAQYTVVLAVAVQISVNGESLPNFVFALLVGCGGPVALAVLLHYLFRWFRAVWIWSGIAMLVVVPALLLTSIEPSAWKSVGQAVLFSTLLYGPLWALESYAVMAWLSRGAPLEGRPGRRRPWALVSGWIVTWVASWAGAIAAAVRAYRALPTRPTGQCYVATAAARGHPWVVGTRDAIGVNDQMRRLKCAEIALAVVAPRMHRAVRRVYDVVGPRLARGMVHPVVADVGYLLLKPAEWAALFCLRRIVRDFDTLAAGVYSAEERSGVA
jgi:hypothetical protein